MIEPRVSMELGRAFLSPSAGEMEAVPQVAAALAELARQVKQEFTSNPELIVQISDLSAPGGVVIGSELQCAFAVPPALVTARVQKGEGQERAIVDIGGVPGYNTEHILIVDDVIFSGTTMHAVVDKISVMYPESKIGVGCLVLHAASRVRELLQDRAVEIFFSTLTRNREMRFPWGVAEWYGNLPLNIGQSTVEIEVTRRPWGFYEEYALNTACSVRMHTLYAKQRMSMQRHHDRDEFFVPLDVGITYVLQDQELETVPGDYVFIPRGEWHRIINTTSSRKRLLEVSFGYYDQVKDIERKEDDYGRVGYDGSV